MKKQKSVLTLRTIITDVETKPFSSDYPPSRKEGLQGM
jgi:hypothetical protein